MHYTHTLPTPTATAVSADAAAALVVDVAVSLSCFSSCFAIFLHTFFAIVFLYKNDGSEFIWNFFPR